jgi:hypothetical protein
MSRVLSIAEEKSLLQGQVDELASRRTAFIAGGGKHGSIALKYFMNQPRWKVIVGEESRSAEVYSLVNRKINLDRFTGALPSDDTSLVIGDATVALSALFLAGVVPELIVPCVPFHFAAKVLARYLTSKGLKVRPLFEPLKRAYGKANLSDMEYRLNEDNALLVASRMPFNLQCAPNCMQSRQCPVTGRKLLKPMYDLAAEALSDERIDIVRVLRSRLLAPSVGGFSGRDLKNTIDLCIEKAPCSIAIVTSCSCHIVANTLKIMS